METLKDILDIFRPLIEVVILTVGVPAIAVVSTKIVSHLNIKDEAEREKIEATVNDALHKSAQNAMVYAAAKLRIPLVSLAVGNVEQRNEVLAEAMDYVYEKNPDALRKLGVDGKMLKDILMSKIPPQ